MKRLIEINDELERAVFLSVYHSRQQQQWRLLARWVLMLKHVLRVSSNRLIFLSLLLPGLLVWFFIYLKGARADYNLLVHEQILEKGFIRKLIWPNV